MQQIQFESYTQLSPQYNSAETDKNLKTSGPSFQDILNSLIRDEQSEPVKEQKTVSYKEQKVEPEEEKVEIQDSDEDDEKNSSKIYQPQELVFFNSENVEDKTSYKISFNANSTDTEKLNTTEIDVNSAINRQKQVSPQEMNWLLTKDAENLQEKLTGEDVDFASLIENAAEFVPGNETDEELLEKAQNLAVKDPSKFLENAEKVAAGDKSIQLDDKTAEKKTTPAEKNGRKEVKFTVEDFRTKQQDNNIVEAKAVTKVQPKEQLNVEFKQTAQNQMQVTMDLSQNIQQDITSSSSQAAGANGSTFQSMLQNSIQANASDIVKAGSIVLKDNNQGSINMILKPESLGNVKVSLAVSDKVITGNIIVHSQEAYDAMKNSIDSLKEAFAKNGFEAAELNLTMASDNQFAQNQNGDGTPQRDTFGARRTYGDFVSVSQTEENESLTETVPHYSSQVNIVA